MRFLVLGERVHEVPTDMLPRILDGAIDWVKRYKANGKLELAYLNAGRQAGCYIFNVGSLEELNTIMTEFPLAAYGKIQVIPLVDAIEGLTAQKHVVEAFATVAGRR